MRANTTLFRSRAVLVAAGALLVVLALLGFRLPRDWHDGGAHGAMLVTGWSALIGMLAVLAYVLRKYMHKLGYSPEFARKLPLAEIEAFHGRLNQLQLEVLRGEVREPSAIRSRLPEVLRGVERVMTVEIETAKIETGANATGASEPGPSDAPPRLVARPTEPFGRTARWLHVHLYFGLLFAVLVLLHGRAGLHSTLGSLLNACAFALSATGLVGIALWSLGPTWLSREERRQKLSIEQAFVFRKHYRLKVRAALAALDASTQPALREVWKARAAADFQGRARQALLGPAFADPKALHAGREVLVLIGQYQRVRRAFRGLWRVRLSFMAWRFLHAPIAILMLGLALLHLVSVWKY